MSRLPQEIKEKAINLRSKGYSIKEIADKLNIAKSTASLWVRDIRLKEVAIKRLEKKKLLSYYKTSLRWDKKKKKEKLEYNKRAQKIITKIGKDKNHTKVYCTLLYWCEGGKATTDVRFINSDPELIRTFLELFRSSFDIDEKKFRVLMHLHSYHNEVRQKIFWSKITGVSKKLFQKTYQKQNTGKQIHENYQGCISVRYYDARIAKELSSIYKNFSKNMGA